MSSACSWDALISFIRTASETWEVERWYSTLMNHNYQASQITIMSKRYFLASLSKQCLQTVETAVCKVSQETLSSRLAFSAFSSLSVVSCHHYPITGSEHNNEIWSSDTNDAESAANMSQLTSYSTIIEQQSAVLNAHKYFKYFISNLMPSCLVSYLDSGFLSSY